MLMYIGYGVAFYYGAHLVLLGEASPGTVFTVIIINYCKTSIPNNNYFLGFL